MATTNDSDTTYAWVRDGDPCADCRCGHAEEACCETCCECFPCQARREHSLDAEEQLALRRFAVLHGLATVTCPECQRELPGGATRCKDCDPVDVE
jgi:hypothetical protein